MGEENLTDCFICNNCNKKVSIAVPPWIGKDGEKLCSYECYEEYEAKQEKKQYCYYCEREIRDLKVIIKSEDKIFCCKPCLGSYKENKESEMILKPETFCSKENQTYNDQEINDILDKAIIKDDPVKNPNHYNWIPGIECKDVVKYFSFHIGNAIKYLWRHKYKGKIIEDLQKAIENINCEIEFLKEQEAEKPQE